MKRRRYELGVGLLLVGAALITAFMALRVGALSSLGPRVEINVAIEDAGGLKAGTEVAVAGVGVGKITGLEIEHDVARATLLVDREAEIRQDAQVKIRSRSVLGEKYLEIVPVSRSAPLITDGDELARVAKQTEIDEIVNALGPVLASVDGELLGRVLEHLAQAIEEDPERVSRMLDNADALLANLAVVSDDLPELVEDGRDAVAAVEDAAAEVEARAAEAEELIAKADGTLEDLQAATEPLPGVVADAGAAIDEAREALEPLDAAAEDLAEIAEALAGLDEHQIERLLLEEGIRIRLFDQRKRLKDKNKDEAEPGED